MNAKTLKIALAASVALNLFAIGGGVAAWVTHEGVEKRAEEQRRSGRQPPVMAVIDGLEPPVRDRVRAALRASALAAKPDFEEARAARREAIEQARSPTFDAAAVTALLDRSRTAEMRGRARLEQDSTLLLDSLDVADRQALSSILSRHGPRGRGGREREDGAREGSRERTAP